MDNNEVGSEQTHMSMGTLWNIIQSKAYNYVITNNLFVAIYYQKYNYLNNKQYD